jgi:transposase
MSSPLTIEEIELKLKAADTLEQFKRWQVILLRTKYPQFSINDISSICQVPYRTVTQWTWIYHTEGPEKFALTSRGGRHHVLLSFEDETKLLAPFEEKANNGNIITAKVIKDAAETLLGKKLNKDYVYNLLHRHKWKKVMPKSVTCKIGNKVLESLKNSKRIFWIPPSITIDE